MANNSIDIVSLDRPDISLSSDVTGFQETKELLRKAINKTKSRSDIDESCSSILLYGAPGAGKSYIAKGLVSEADSMKFYYVQAFDLTTKYIDGKEAMSSLFRRARENKPCIVLLDDIDAFSKARSEGRSERGQEVKAEFLSEVQAVNNGILLMATTCLPWDVDQTILDSFDTKIHIGMPDIDARKEMILVNLRKTPHDLTDDDIVKIASETDGAMSSLFRRARENKPCIVLLDDIDAFSKARSEGRSERGQEVKAEFLSEVQAVNNGILLMATTCLPWDVDQTILDSFDTKIHIGMPDIDARKEMILVNLRKTPHDLTDDDIVKIASETDGYSPADMVVLIHDAMMVPVRKIQIASHFKKVTGPSPNDPEIIVDDLLEPCPPDFPDAVAMTWMDVPADKIHVPLLNMSDVLECLMKTKRTITTEEIEKYKMFESTTGE